MELFNIGPWELVLILVLAMVVFGPEGMVKFARESAVFIRKVTRSSFWQELVSTSEEIKDIPRKLVKEADLEESLREINRLQNSIKKPDDDVEVVGESTETTKE